MLDNKYKLVERETCQNSKHYHIRGNYKLSIWLGKRAKIISYQMNIDKLVNFVLVAINKKIIFFIVCQ
jgi:large-conductance mechanosensitive channel